MSKRQKRWTKGCCSYERHMGIFKLHVWPHEATAKDPYQAWAVIDWDGSSSALPSSGRLKKKFDSLDEAKAWIEDAMRTVFRTALDELVGDPLLRLTSE